MNLLKFYIERIKTRNLKRFTALSSGVLLSLTICATASTEEVPTTSSAPDRWDDYKHKCLAIAEKDVVMPTLNAMLDIGPKDKMFDHVMDFIGGMRRALASATFDEHSRSFGVERSNIGFAYTPIGAYPLMTALVKPLCFNASEYFKNDGEWHELSNDFEYRFNLHSVRNSFEACRKMGQDGLEHLMRMRMILYGDKNSIGGPAGVVFLQKTLPNQKKSFEGDFTLIERCIEDSIACEKGEEDKSQVKIGSLDFRFRGEKVQTRRLFWIEDTTGKTDHMAITLFHPSGPCIRYHELLCKTYFNQALALPTETDVETKKVAIARFSYILSLAMPYPRGSALCNEWMTMGLYYKLGLEAPDREFIKMYDEFSQSSFTFQDFLSHILPNLKSSHPGLFEIKEFKTPIVETLDPTWTQMINPLSICVFPYISKETPLCSLMKEAGSDKNSVRHTYTQLYHHLLKDRRESIKNVLEIGIGSCDPQFGFTMGENGVVGASVRAYRNYFPNAMIFGADIDKVALFDEERIHCLFTDGFKPEVLKESFEEIGVKLDLIIDDGFHDFVTNRNCLLEGLNHLTDDGLYIVEDVRTDQIPLFRDLISTLTDHTCAIVQLIARSNSYDNNVILVKKKKSSLDNILTESTENPAN